MIWEYATDDLEDSTVITQINNKEDHNSDYWF